MQITYGYYVDEYGGRTIPEQDFRKAERQAEAYIRHLTYVKGDIFAVENDVVKDAVCAAAEVYYKYNAQQQSGVPLVIHAKVASGSRLIPYPSSRISRFP